MRVAAERIREQLVAVFGAWGMSPEHAAVTAEMMVETDLRGVDSHGVSMLPTYDREFRAGRLNMRPQWKTQRDRPAMARIGTMHPAPTAAPSRIVPLSQSLPTATRSMRSRSPVRRRRSSVRGAARSRSGSSSLPMRNRSSSACASRSCAPSSASSWLSRSSNRSSNRTARR